MPLKPWTLAVSALLLLALLAGAADSPRAQSASKDTEYVQKQASKNRVELSVRVPKNTEAGLPVRVQLVLSNLSDKPIELDGLNIFDNFRLTVLDCWGKPVAATRFGREWAGIGSDPANHRGSRKPFDLRTKRRYTLEMNLALLFDLTVPESTGKYHLAVTKAVNEHTDSEFKLEVSDLEFTITGPSMEATESDVEPK